MKTYLDWMRSAYLITATGCPAISVPAGSTADGLPVGVQLVAPYGADRRLLEIAGAFEGAFEEAGDAVASHPQPAD
jgi:amidase